MLYYAQKAITNNILDQGPFYYYAGLASYELKDYTQAVLYLQEALKHKFTYSQTFQALGLSLQALNRPESIVAITAARKMSKEGKDFEPEKERRELVIY
jgi:tetratricopeptide (TPR) repeat protein